MNTDLKPIPGFPGYKISREGRVWSEPNSQHKTGKWLKPYKYDKYDHLGVVLYRGKKAYHRYVHCLVLETFVEPRPEGMECRHLDGDPTNNHLNNLRWGTRVENASDQVRHGTDPRGVRNGISKLEEDDVRLVRVWCGLGYKQQVIAEAFGIYRGTVSNIKTGRGWGWLKNLDGSPYVSV